MLVCLRQCFIGEGHLEQLALGTTGPSEQTKRLMNVKRIISKLQSEREQIEKEIVSLEGSAGIVTERHRRRHNSCPESEATCRSSQQGRTYRMPTQP